MDVDGWMDPSSSPRHGPKATKPLSESRVIPLAVISLDFFGFPWISLNSLAKLKKRAESLYASEVAGIFFFFVRSLEMDEICTENCKELQGNFKGSTNFSFNRVGSNRHDLAPRYTAG